MVYQESWYERPATGGAATVLAVTPPWVDLVGLAFAKPDLVYPGALDLRQTGLAYGFPGSVLREAVALLKARQPATRVLLSVGGLGYDRWEALDAGMIARLVADLGLDGVDIDFEPATPDCAGGGATPRHCASDAVLIDVVTRLRAALPRPLVLMVTGWSVGAYGDGPFLLSPPASPWTGLMLGLLRSPVAAKLDLVSVMAYGAGPSYDPFEALRAYRAVWPGPLLLGVGVPSADQALPPTSVAAAEALARRAAAQPRTGAMLYALYQRPAGPLSEANPDGRALAAALCRGLALTGCERGFP